MRQRHADSIHDVIDSSPPDVQPSRIRRDSIEADSIPSSSFATAEVPVYDHESLVEKSDSELLVHESDPEQDAPSPKRRRLSMSSGLEDEDQLTLDSMETSDHVETAQSNEERLLITDDEFDSANNSEAPESPGIPVVQQQPTFQRAPRFQPAKRPDVAAVRDPLPDAFSPRRRGTRDVPGGLAAQVRDWLMDIESNTGSKRDGDFVARISVDEFRRGQGMVLVKGRSVPDDTVSSQQRPLTGLQVMLAGEGRLLDLARRNDVAVGALVAIAKPVWEVNLGPEGRWAVACDWVVL